VARSSRRPGVAPRPSIPSPAVSSMESEQGGHTRAARPGAALLPMVLTDVGVRHRSYWRCRSSWSGRCLAACATAALVGGRGARLAAGRTPPVGAGVPAASGSRSWCRRRGGRARRWRRILDGAKSMPSSCAHRCSGAAIGRPRSGSCQVPTDTAYRTHVRGSIGNATDCDRTGRRAQRRPEQTVVPTVSLGASGSRRAATDRRRDQHDP
jgi:hypothetical protein